MVAGLVGRSVAKGLLSGATGMVATVIGPDPILGTQRLTMGIPFLEGGLPFLPAIGYAMVKARIPLAPLILGVVQGNQIEANLIRALATDPDPWQFLLRPISGAMPARRPPRRPRRRRTPNF